jgi:hypothetical protein
MSASVGVPTVIGQFTCTPGCMAGITLHRLGAGSIFWPAQQKIIEFFGKSTPSSSPQKVMVLNDFVWPKKI